MTEKDQQQGTPVLSLAEAVRKRPGMYFGDIGPLALNAAIYEAVANSVDEYLAGRATKVGLTIVDNRIVVSDDGRGLPFEKESPRAGFANLVEYYFMNRHDTPTADGHAPHIHLVGGGLGLAVLNAASHCIKVTSSNGSSVWTQQFGKGQVVSQAVQENTGAAQGTTLEIELDPELFQGHKPDKFDLRKTMFELAHFYPGLIVELDGETFIARNGLLDLADIHYQNDPAAWAFDAPKRFFYQDKSNDVQLQVAAIGESDNETRYLSWVNGSASVEGGVHVDGLKQAFKTAGWSPKLALIHIIMWDPVYAGPSKDVLKSDAVAEIVQRLLEQPLQQFQQRT